MQAPNEAFQHYLIDESPDCIKVLDLQGRLLYMNPGGQLTMEIDDFTQCKDTLWIDFWHGKEKEKVYEAVSKAKAGRAGSFQAFCPTGKGTPKWWDVLVAPMFNSAGEIEHLLAVSRDMTARKQVQAAHAELDHFFSLSLDLLCVLRLDGSFKKMNATFERVLGYSQQELFANPFPLWVHPDDLESCRKAFQQLRMGIPLHYFEHRYRTKEGSFIWVAWTALPVVEEDLIYAVGRNITEQKQREQQKDFFISMTSHELRTPLTAIKTSLQLAMRRIQKFLNRSEGLSSENQTIVNDVLPLLSSALRQTTVQTRLIDDLLDASRIQSDKLHIALARCDLLDIVREVVKDQRSVTPTRTITLDLPELPSIPVMVDAGRIGQVLSNYVTNALKYSEETQPVNVGVTVTEQEVRVWVRDNGPGLSREAQEHIWERFYQVRGNQKHPTSGGAGLELGLHICQALIARHSGEVGVESIPGHGSTFWFTVLAART
jgi:PAS domain S-box-containing protein